MIYKYSVCRDAPGTKQAGKIPRMSVTASQCCGLKPKVESPYTHILIVTLGDCVFKFDLRVRMEIQRSSRSMSFHPCGLVACFFLAPQNRYQPSLRTAHITMANWKTYRIKCVCVFHCALFYTYNKLLDALYKTAVHNESVEPLLQVEITDPCAAAHICSEQLHAKMWERQYQHIYRAILVEPWSREPPQAPYLMKLDGIP